ncbi:hypothetical protein V2J09_019230 [Rumex salicifolius]
MASLFGITVIVVSILVTLFLFIGLPLLLIFTGHSHKDPTFFLETSTVKAYNLTSDNRLFCIINLGVRAENHNTRKKSSFGFSGIDMEVRKGKHHKLADDALLNFNVGPRDGVVVDVEAVGLHVGLKKKIAAEVRADVVAGEGRVNVFMTGFVGSDYLDVKCKNVVVDFSRSTVRKQNVKCKVTVTAPDSGCSTNATICAFVTIVILFIVVGLPLIIVFAGGHGSKDPNFSVESTMVKAYNLTSDNQLFCIINIGVKAHNPNPKKHSFYFAGIDMEVRKGKHHKLADDALRSFGVGPGGDTVVDVEAVGLRVGLKKKIAKEVRADVAAGEGRVNLFMSGYVGSNYLGVTCKNVMVDFSKLMVKVNQNVKCGVTVTSPNDNTSGETVMPVEAVGLKRKIAEELKGDVVAGEGPVNVFMSGFVGKYILRQCGGWLYAVNDECLEEYISVETSTVKAYNLTSDNQEEVLFWFSGIDMEVRKGKHHKLSDDALWNFKLSPRDGVVVDVEAEEEEAGEGRVNVFLSGMVGKEVQECGG